MAAVFYFGSQCVDLLVGKVRTDATREKIDLRPSTA